MLSPRESTPLDHPLSRAAPPDCQRVGGSGRLVALGDSPRARIDAFRGHRWAVIAFAVMSSVIIGHVRSALAGPAPSIGTGEDVKARCTRLVGATFGPARVTAANYIDASVSGSAAQQGHCVAQASKIDQPDFKMEAQLPANWDGVIVHGGGGGLDGFIPAGLPWAPAQPVDQGMVFLASNGGHQGDPAGTSAQPKNREDDRHPGG